MDPSKFSERDADAGVGEAFHLLPIEMQAHFSGRVWDAVRHDKLIPHYQPIVDMATGDIIAVEALARWMDASNGLIGPDRFIPAAETGGFIGDLFFQILRRVCADASRWADIQVSVNVSPAQFQDPFLASKILSVLGRTGFDPARLEVEITEGMPLHDWVRAARTLEELRAEGVSFALDDFGTGYANLSHLRELPFDSLKVDRSFVTALTERDENRKIVRSILRLAEDFGLTTVAEGIETKAQFDWLRDAGCAWAQGHYFFFPQPASEIDELV